MVLFFPFWECRKEKKLIDMHMDNVHVFIKRILEERRHTGRLPQDDDWMASFMFDSYNDTLTDEEVYPAAMDALLGGSAQQFTVYWGMYQLSKKPKLLDKLYEEVSSQLGHSDIDASNMHKLKLLNAFVMELYRHQPGGGGIQARTSLEKDVMHGWEIPEKTNFVLNVLRVHRDPRFWDEPDKFDPERWIRVLQDFTL